MEKNSDKIRIKDIARLAGVSAGTVDRVLHNRGEVSVRTREKIETVLKELDYRPNLYASALASKRHYKVAAVLPKAGGYDYWIEVLRGVDLAAKEYANLNIDVEQILFDQYDSCRVDIWPQNSFCPISCLKKILLFLKSTVTAMSDPTSLIFAIRDFSNMYRKNSQNTVYG